MFPEENYLCLERYFVLPDGNSMWNILLFKRVMKSQMIHIELNQLMIVGDHLTPMQSRGKGQPPRTTFNSNFIKIFM